MSRKQGEFLCQCKDCEAKRENRERHLNHPFYQAADEYREAERIGQIVKGSEKYPEPFNPASWTFKQLLQHAMQENVDQGHYIYGLAEKAEEMEARLIEAEKNAEFHRLESEYWRMQYVRLTGKGSQIDERV